MCNACHQYWTKNGVPRPLGMVSKGIKRCKRVGAGKKEEGSGPAKRVKREEGAPPTPTIVMVKQEGDKDFDFEVFMGL